MTVKNKKIQIILPEELHAEAKRYGVCMSIVCRAAIRHRLRLIKEGIERDRHVERII